MTTTTAFRERLHVPLRWWVQGTMLIATLWLALVVAIPGVVAWSVTAVCLGLLSAFFVSYGGAEVRVQDGVLRVGRAHIEARYLGAVTALDPEQTRRSAGRDVDARAFLVLRPYLKRSVRVGIDDAEDPAPYWLISTRRPDQLAAAIGDLTRASSA
ncbi:MAG: DUF3093 domain-containing protein [Nocardioides sp.]